MCILLPCMASCDPNEGPVHLFLVSCLDLFSICYKNQRSFARLRRMYTLSETAQNVLCLLFNVGARSLIARLLFNVVDIHDL